MRLPRPRPLLLLVWPRRLLTVALIFSLTPPWPPDWTLVGLVAVLLTLDVLTTPKGLPVGYRNPLIRIDLAEALDAEEFEGMWITLRNPKLQTQATLTPPDVELDADGTPSIADAMLGMQTVAARMIYDWNLPDPADPREDAPPLPIQHPDDKLRRGPSVEDVAKLPGSVVVMIGERIRQAVAPR